MSGYTIGEIIVWLLLAAILGFILGWLLRTLKCQREHSAAARSAAPAKAAAPVAASVAAPAKAATLSGAGQIESAGFANSAKPLAGGKAPSAEYTIKGNADSMYFHTPSSRSYGQTIAEVWFKTEADARAAGFTAPGEGGAAKASAKKAPAKKAVAPGKFAGSAKPLAGGKAPSAEYKIKGNEDSMIYHTPESPSYERTIAETWFKTEAAAVAAGFRKPKNA